MSNPCELSDAHPDTEWKDRPKAVTMVMVSALDDPSMATSRANAFLCEDCAEREGVLE